MESLILRKAEARDHAFIVEAQIQMAQESEGLALVRATVEKGVHKVLNKNDLGFYLLAEKAHEPVGVMLVLKEWSDWRNAWIYWIHSLYVVKSSRRQGVFKSMYQHLKNEVLASENLKGIRLYVDKKNTDAQKVYETIGMSRDHYALCEWLK